MQQLHLPKNSRILCGAMATMIYVICGIEENRVFLSTQVDAADKGQVLGKDGCLIKAVRTVLTAAATNQDKKVTLKLEDK